MPWRSKMFPLCGDWFNCWSSQLYLYLYLFFDIFYSIFYIFYILYMNSVSFFREAALKPDQNGRHVRLFSD